MDARILVVAPFADLGKVAQEVIEECFSGVPDMIKIAEGDLYEGTSIAERAVAEGIEVIVSRGGTASLIAKHVDIPIVNIQVTVLDVLRALRQIDNYPARVGVAGFKNVIYGCEDLEDLWGISFYEIALENEKEASEKIAAAARQGISLLVGDAISVKLAPQYGMRGALIQSGKEAVYKAIKEAQQIAQVRRKEQERSELLKTVIDAAADGIIATDVDSNITIFNPMAEELFQLSSTRALGCPLQEVIPQLDVPGVVSGEQLKVGDIQRIGNKMLAVKSVPVKVKGEVVGTVTSFQNVSQLQQVEQMIRKKLYAKGLVARTKISDIDGSSAALQTVKRKATQYAQTQSTILITGESGTGKEMLAQSIHNMSKRKNGPFVAINCAALPENLLESELFGYEEGAFTGAKKGGKQGLFELGHGGTIFLDEIGEMPLSLQSRLLRVLQEKEVMRLGGDGVIPVDVRIIAATNQNLPELLNEKKFRHDLYYRLDILRIHMPPLRERVEDIPLLARRMIHKMFRINPQITDISAAGIRFLQACSWQGNVRQLVNTLERAMLLSEGTIITEKDLREVFDEGVLQIAGSEPGLADRPDSLLVMEQQTLERVLAEEEYNYSRAAARLGIHRTTLWRKINNRTQKK